MSANLRSRIMGQSSKLGLPERNYFVDPATDRLMMWRLGPRGNRRPLLVVPSVVNLH
jgi:hypothetical protein